MPNELPSWADTPTRAAIVDFVERVTTGPDAVPESERVAVFDNDGTLWSEKPMPTQLHYIVEQWRTQAAADPSLADEQPYKAAVTGDFAWLGGAIDKHYAGDDRDLKVLIGALVGVTAGMSVDDYATSVTEFYATAKHLTLGTPYADAVYAPMVELLRYLEAHGFSVYIVSGGERDFMRPMTQQNYGIPPERVVGSAFGLSYDPETHEVRYAAGLDVFDDGPEKPVRIWSRIGRRPLFAGGNSNGDQAMLDFTRKGGGFALVVHHDDDTDRGDIPYDKGAEKVLAEASANGYAVVSVKRDWTRIFPQG
ncbi:HAD family hydrolase [Agromyces sp. H3Y2-19a]|uniref:HAD family hydrolase n=1 Tax=Agromyces TaxID=33877 RepID=UPI001E4CC8B1|nr:MULTISPECIES: HAD family hydrolase [Agromyces]MCD5344994.1 haloacid dehalogenase-like hydrolase [Agromyces sp. S2-1-8]MDF0513825.1 HAD family hydrolase [Agromyces chromiiresistens]